MSAGPTNCVPAIHCRLLIVGRAGTPTSALYSRSCDFGSGWPVPHTFITPISDGPVHATISPAEVTRASLSRAVSNVFDTFARPISFRPGMENARAVPSPKSPTRQVRLPITASSRRTTAEERRKMSGNSRWEGLGGWEEDEGRRRKAVVGVVTRRQPGNLVPERSEERAVGVAGVGLPERGENGEIDTTGEEGVGEGSTVGGVGETV